MVKERAKAKFDETIEIAMNLGVDPKHADQMVRGVVTLPNGTGRSVRVGVFARGAKADEAKAAGADVVGAEDLVEKVNGGQIDFDRCIATPDMMGLVGRLGKVLGPRGLMPNPRVGTVTMDVANAVKGAKGGSVEFRVEKAGILQAGVGKASFSEDKLVENIKAFADAVNKAKPAGAKGHYINRVVDLLDHGPGREGRHGDARRERRRAAVTALRHPKYRMRPGSAMPGLSLYALPTRASIGSDARLDPFKPSTSAAHRHCRAPASPCRRATARRGRGTRGPWRPAHRDSRPRT